MLKAYELFPIDCAGKAYLLGFLGCDSSLYSPSNKMLLEIADEPVMKFCSEMMDHDYTPYSKYDKRTDKTYTGYRMYRCIVDICQYYNGRLKSERIIPYKLVPDCYMSFLIQGIFDADGSFTIYEYSPTNIGLRLEIASSHNIIKTVHEIINVYLNINAHVKDRGSYMSLFIYNRNEIFSFLQWIYRAPWFLPLPRKYENACRALNTIMALNKPGKLPALTGALDTSIHKPFTTSYVP